MATFVLQSYHMMTPETEIHSIFSDQKDAHPMFCHGGNRTGQLSLAHVIKDDPSCRTSANRSEVTTVAVALMRNRSNNHIWVMSLSHGVLILPGQPHKLIHVQAPGALAKALVSHLKSINMKTYDTTTTLK